MLAPHLLINVREMKEVEEGLGGGLPSSAAADGRGPLVELIAPEQKLAILQK